MAVTVKDHMAFYLRFLEDVFPYMEKYHDKTGMGRVLSELTVLLENPSCGTVNDRALLLDYKSSQEKKTEKAVQLRKDALALLSEITAGNAHLAANINANLGSLYRQAGEYALARSYMERGISILAQYKLTNTHDSIPQICNYAMLLADVGETSRGMAALRKLSRVIKENHSDMSGDYAVIQEAMGGICLAQGNVRQATEYFKCATHIYEVIWEDAPELIEEKYNEIMGLYPQIGSVLGQYVAQALQKS